MSAAAVEHPCHDGPEPSLLETADLITDRLPGLRVEILGGEITVTPPPDGPHGESLTDLVLAFASAGLHSTESRVIQAIGLWLPTGAEDFAIPDLAVVDADYRDHLVEHNCYDPAVFRLVLEVTSSNYRTDLQTKVGTYAAAGIPVYVIVDRRKQRVHVLTGPQDQGYAQHAVYAPGAMFPVPAPVSPDGNERELSVDAALLLSRD
ncbi:Uma2 family endonuclease [Streptomyces sp. NPDC059398]|uniref:Uma2 family endonuclease n=1 Tax=Streptomyces sp. NPDC059398 TaxID=3346820 RepID=UPI0036736821